MLLTDPPNLSAFGRFILFKERCSTEVLQGFFFSLSVVNSFIRISEACL